MKCFHVQFLNLSFSFREAQLPSGKLSGSIFEGLAKNDFAIGDKIARWVNKKSGTKALILLPDGINVQYSKLEEGIHKGLPFYKKLPIFGGLSSDNLELVKTYQIHNGKVYTNSVLPIHPVGATQS